MSCTNINHNKRKFSIFSSILTRKLTKLRLNKPNNVSKSLIVRPSNFNDKKETLESIKDSFKNDTFDYSDRYSSIKYIDSSEESLTSIKSTNNLISNNMNKNESKSDSNLIKSLQRSNDSVFDLFLATRTSTQRRNAICPKIDKLNSNRQLLDYMEFLLREDYIQSFLL